MLKQPARRLKRYTMKRPLLTLTLFLICLCGASGQDSFIRQRLTHFSVRNGMSYNTVVDFEQDSSGNIWFATADGLDRFNGTDFTIYRHRHNEMTRTVLRATMSMTCSLTRRKDSGCALPQDSPIIERRPMISKESASRTL